MTPLVYAISVKNTLVFLGRCRLVHTTKLLLSSNWRQIKWNDNVILVTVFDDKTFC